MAFRRWMMTLSTLLYQRTHYLMTTAGHQRRERPPEDRRRNVDNFYRASEVYVTENNEYTVE